MGQWARIGGGVLGGEGGQRGAGLPIIYFWFKNTYGTFVSKNTYGTFVSKNTYGTFVSKNTYGTFVSKNTYGTFVSKIHMVHLFQKYIWYKPYYIHLFQKYIMVQTLLYI